MRSGDNEKFRMHLELYHEVFSHFEIVLALHFLRDEGKENIVKAVKHRIEETENTGISFKQEILAFLEHDFDVSEDTCENEQKKEREHFEENNEDETNFEENNENQTNVHEDSPENTDIESDNVSLDEHLSFDKTVNDDTLEKENRDKGENEDTDFIEVREVNLMDPEKIYLKTSFIRYMRVRMLLANFVKEISVS